jgi:3',5'-cyclic AMP phosphodiesterase CpdA
VDPWPDILILRAENRKDRVAFVAARADPAYYLALVEVLMLRFAFTSDLHFDTTGSLTTPEEIRRVAGEVAASHADALVVAGDIGHPLHNFRLCLDALAGRAPHVGIVVGNHDVWHDEHHSSAQLWETTLPAEARERGMYWLETDPIVVDRVAIVGSMVWYDYSAAEPSIGRDQNYYAAIKPQVSNDAHWLDWEWSDLEIARKLREQLLGQLERLEADRNIDRVIVATHVPVFEQQIRRDPTNLAWSIANAYFGNLTTGQAIMRFPKVRAVVSGHLHMSIQAVVPRPRMTDIQACVIGSDYGAPTWLLLDM